jgi:hypothetical protein
MSSRYAPIKAWKVSGVHLAQALRQQKAREVASKPISKIRSLWLSFKQSLASTLSRNRS